MNSTATLNNEGAAFLRADNYNSAIRSFAAGLDIMRTLQDTIDVSPDAMQTCLSSRMKACVAGNEVTSEDGCTIYSQAIGLFMLGNRHSIGQEDFHLATLTLLFNLGLAYHLRSTTNSSSSKFRDVKRAKHLYQVGMKALFNIISPGSSSHWSHYFMAVFGNNLGCIAIEEYDFATIDCCLELTTVEDVPVEAPSIILNHISWGAFKRNPAAAA